MHDMEYIYFSLLTASSWIPERFLVLPLQTFLKEPSIFFFRKRLCFGHSEFLSWKRAVTQVDCTITNLSEQYMLNYSNGKRWRGSLHSKLWLTSFGFGSHLKKITFIFSRYGSVLLEAQKGGKQNTGDQLQPLKLSVLRLFNQV